MTEGVNQTFTQGRFRDLQDLLVTRAGVGDFPSKLEMLFQKEQGLFDVLDQTAAECLTVQDGGLARALEQGTDDTDVKELEGRC